MKEAQTRFVAEVDSCGAVAWVSRIGAGDRIARPINDSRIQLGELTSAEFFGAPRDDIQDWLRARLT